MKTSRKLNNFDRIADKIRLMRTETGTTQAQLAIAADMSVSGLQDIESGKIKTPRPQTLSRIAAVFGVSDLCFYPLKEITERDRAELLSLPVNIRFKTIRISAMKNIREVVVVMSLPTRAALDALLELEAGNTDIDTISAELPAICKLLAIQLDIAEIYFGKPQIKVDTNVLDNIIKPTIPSGSDIPQLYQTLITKIPTLNAAGLAKLIEITDDLTLIDKYTKKD